MNIKYIRKKLRPLKVFYNYLLLNIGKFIIFFTPNFILDISLDKKVFCSNKDIKFTIRDYGKICRFRAKTFQTKEPDTLEWIDNFKKNSKLIDIGANIGIYSIYASERINKIYAFEPDALNYSLLNLNIYDNGKSDKIKAFPIAMHSKEVFDQLNIQNYNWGGALSSFSNTSDQFENNFLPVMEQGSFSLTLDQVIDKLQINGEINCKIDVDGNEYKIIQGAKKSLEKKIISSFLIELDTNRSDYQLTLDLFSSYNYKLVSKKASPIFKEVFGTTQNHIFDAN